MHKRGLIKQELSEDNAVRWWQPNLITSILRVLLKQYRSPTDPNKFKSATIISVHLLIAKKSLETNF